MNRRIIILLAVLFNVAFCQAQSDDIELTDENSTEWEGGGGGGLNPQTPTGAVTSLTLSQTSATLAGGETMRLTATVNADAQNKKLTWASSNPAVATVNQDGLVRGLKTGTATITVAAIGNTSLKRTCSITVTSDYTFRLIYMVDNQIYKTIYVDIGTAITPEQNPTKEGYTFSGWSEIPATMPAHDVTVNGSFTANQYTVTFVLGNGEENVVKTQDYATNLETPNDPVREGYTFTGWDVEVPATVPASDKTFTAQWQINQYAMTFVLGNGEENVVKTQDYATNLETPNDPVREGYTFTGWDVEVPATVPASDKTFTAQWQINQYTMTFVLGNGEENVVKTQDYATALEAPTPEREGYTFTGWDVEVPATVPASDKSFTALWQINQYKVTFVAEGVTVKEETLDYGTAIVAPDDPVKEGYTFSGWGEVAATVPAQDVTYTATFTVNQYTVTYYMGDQVWEVDTYDYGAIITLRTYTPDDSRYTFIEWDGETYETMPAHDIEYHASIADGIQTILGDVQTCDVYTLSGKKLMSGVPAKTVFTELPRGIYIINGKKIFLK